jgi:acyl-CoA hydrolase
MEQFPELQELLFTRVVVLPSANDIQYVVTEYGIAKLEGRGIRERAHALIEIAHPKFRDELRDQAKERHLW